MTGAKYTKLQRLLIEAKSELEQDITRDEQNLAVLKYRLSENNKQLSELHPPEYVI